MSIVVAGDDAAMLYYHRDKTFNKHVIFLMKVTQIPKAYNKKVIESVAQYIQVVLS